MVKYFLVLIFIFAVGFCENSPQKINKSQFISNLCKTLPENELIICKEFSDPTETIFTKNSIIHFRSERDDSESLFPGKSDQKEPSTLKRVKRQWGMFPGGMGMGMFPGMGMGMFPPIMTITQQKGGFNNGPFGPNADVSNFQMTLGK
uniref:Uncharacterized protein n=1 Tax=Panagrolaimus sp. JU765 TaxID=591449 RepID=A0AC34RT06_9BILA